ncbi:MAG TPA: HEAT repeat domain-containing protein [Urbifossiella sp.]|nr:HEAT repeat domain-containing protein [Urbifossiella sp.]
MRTLAILAVLGFSAPVWAQKPEPKYEGKPLIYWIEKYQNADKDQARKDAEVAVIAFGEDAAPAISTLLVMLDDRSGLYRVGVTNMLCAVGPAAKSAVPQLINLLNEKSPRDPNAVIRILCSIGPGAKDAIPAIQRLVLAEIENKRDLDLGIHNCDLHKIGPAVVPLLIELMGLGYEHSAARELAELGPDAKAALPELAKFLKHNKPSVQLQAAFAMWMISKNPDALKLLIDLLESKNLKQIAAAAEALGRIGPAAKAALPALKKRASEELERIRKSEQGLPRDSTLESLSRAIRQIEAKREE